MPEDQTQHAAPAASAPAGIARADALRLGAVAGAGLLGALGGQQAVAPPAAAAGRAAPAFLRAASVVTRAEPLPGVLDLYVNEGYTTMVDDSLEYCRGFGDHPTERTSESPALTISPRVFTHDGHLVESRTYPLGAAAPVDGTPLPAAADAANPGQYLIRRRHWASFFPRRTIIAERGATVRLRVFNGLAGTHELRVDGAGEGGADVTTGPIPSGGSAELSFAAPYPGTYIYHDPTNAPVERALGLFGVLVVHDADDAWRVSPDQAGFEREWLWTTHVVCSNWAAIAAGGGTIDPEATPAVPRFFLLNDRSGYESLGHCDDGDTNRAAREETLVSGYPRQVDVTQFGEDIEAGTIRSGQLVRLVNPGLVTHQIHFHGNHLWTLRRNNVEWEREHGYVDELGKVCMQQWEDVVKLPPMDRKDCIIPVKRPPDATDQVWFSRTEDWSYPMHCHAEPSQTAAGGMYPGGLVAHWTLKA